MTYIIIWAFLIVYVNVAIWATKYIDKKRLSLFNILIIVTVSLILAFQPENMPDYKSYYDGYVYSAEVDFFSGEYGLFDTISRLEITFVFICSLFVKIGLPFRALLFLVAIVTVIVIPRMLALLSNKNEQKDIFIIRCLFICCYTPLYSGIALRAGLMFALCLSAIYFIIFYKRRLVGIILGIVLFFLAFLIQHTFFIFLPVFVLLLLLKWEPSSRRFNIIIMTISVVFVLVGIIFLNRIALNFKNALSFILTKLGVDEYYIVGYVLRGGEQLLGITIVLLLVNLILIELLIIKENISVTYFQSVINLFVIMFILCSSGIRASSRLYDAMLIFIVPTIYLFYDNYIKNRKWISLVGFYVTQVSFVAISVKTCFAVLI